MQSLKAKRPICKLSTMSPIPLKVSFSGTPPNLFTEASRNSLPTDGHFPFWVFKQLAQRLEVAIVYNIERGHR
jgi:hypothetical protein